MNWIAASDFAAATRMLAPKATSTVVRLSDSPVAPASGTDPSRSKDLRAAAALTAAGSSPS